jgi:hypothetical protein
MEECDADSEIEPRFEGALGDRRGRIPAPSAFRHLFLATLQYGSLTLFCAAVGVFTTRVTTNEFFGHIGPGTVLVIGGLLALVGPISERRLMQLEGLLGVVSGLIYIVADTFVSHPPWGIFDGAGSGEQFHVSIYILFAALGACVLLITPKLETPTALHIVLLAAIFALFITGHHQHSAASSIAHNMTALLAGLAAGYRLFGRRTEYGICIIAAAYVLFAGQQGFGGFVSRHGIDPVAWATYWTAVGLLVGALYVRAFRSDSAQRG